MSLRAENVSRAYRTGYFGKSSTILEDANLEIKPRRTLGLVGGSGSGKTTLGKILAGLERPSGGRVLFEGEDIWKMGARDFRLFRRKVQMVFQDPEGSLNPMKSIERSIHEVLGLLKVPRKEWHERALEMLQTVGLSEELLGRRPSQVSGGQNQRIALGRVLLLEPEIIILDEPTSALDISVQAQILHLLKELQRDRGMGYLLISHSPQVVSFMAHDVAVIENGKLI
jgi:peptide/nickel transport system ATP-binding protein